MSHEYGPDGSIVVHHDRCAWTAVHGKESPSPEPWDRAWTFLCFCEVIEGVEAEVRALTLDAAREAVLGAKAVDIAYGRGLDEPAQFVWMNNALAAIDALKEKP